MSNFICEKCGMTNIDCGKQGYKTEREIELEEQNASLQSELDKAIHQLKDYKNALKEYADRHNWSDCRGECDGLVWKTGDNKGWETAQETLKKWEEK